MKKVIILVIYLFFTYNLYSEDIIIFRFNDKSKFKGKWNIRKDIPILLSQQLNKEDINSLYIDKNISINKTSFLLNISKNSNIPPAPVYLTGEIKEFSISQVGVLAVGWGGYTRYSSTVTIKYLIGIKKKNKTIITNISKKVISNNLGLTLLGGPGSEDINLTLIDKLNKIKFGSKKFYKTIIARALIQNIDEIIKFIKKEIKTTKDNIPNVRIIKIKNKYIYLKASKIKKGEKFIIYKEGETIYDPLTKIPLGKSVVDIALIQVDMRINNELVRAKIIKFINKQKINIKMKIRKYE